MKPSTDADSSTGTQKYPIGPKKYRTSIKKVPKKLLKRVNKKLSTKSVLKKCPQEVSTYSFQKNVHKKCSQKVHTNQNRPS